ncbi:DUF4253 domain-containing protein [Shewanella sp. 3B26]|uniref:DUF4253 domain-containing protein n=1 Tax=Shewanella zhuhaiensis TaxID=2919576 RepID=A0AAJ1F1U7_9GAMM|nr:DUF4253 domain-containing protein [Shewanella zhuhaiensis]MCH4295923.1 DUF4253 domain-containing protein [Shewanella zhuhaiensis]
MNKFVVYSTSLIVVAAIYMLLTTIAKVFKSSATDELEKKHQKAMANKAAKAREEAERAKTEAEARRRERIKLTEEETVLIDSLGFDSELILKLKRFTNSAVKPLLQVHNQDITYEDPAGPCEGIFLQSSNPDWQSSVAHKRISFDYGDLMTECESKGYLLFFNHSYTYGNGFAIIKGSEPWDVLHYRKTNANNMGFSTEEIIAKLKEWDVVRVLSVSFDSTLVKFADFPSDPKALAKSVVAFCPDILQQNDSTQEQLEDYFDVCDEIYLWWD